MGAPKTSKSSDKKSTNPESTNPGPPAASSHPTPANTPAHIYLDTTAVRGKCEKELKKIKDACAQPKGSSMAEKLMGAEAASKIASIKKELAKQGAAQWVLDHCDGLAVKPVSPNLAGENAKAVQDLADSIKGLDPKAVKSQVKAEIEKHLGEAVESVKDALKDATETAAEKAAAKKAATLAAGWLGGPWGEAIAVIVCVIDTVYSGYVFAEEVAEFTSHMDGLQKIIQEVPDKLEEMIQEAASNPQKAVADAMSLLARLNACTRARRCQLVSMKETHNGVSTSCKDIDDKEEILPTGPLTGKGCCPGQTGHHVLPGAMFKKCAAYTGGANNCAHQNAPTVCVEGTNNAHGSHGQMHGQLKKQLENEYKSGKIDLDDAIDEGVKSVRHVFPESGCSAACLKAQLKEFYKDFKNCSPLDANPGTGGSKGGGNDGSKDK